MVIFQPLKQILFRNCHGRELHLLELGVHGTVPVLARPKKPWLEPNPKFLDLELIRNSTCPLTFLKILEFYSRKKFSQEIFSWIEHGTINIPYPINCGLTRNYIRWRKFSPVLLFPWNSSPKSGGKSILLELSEGICRVGMKKLPKFQP